MTNLQTFFDEHTVPCSIRSTGFLEMIDKQHHENINSALYAHFLNSSHEEVKGLFIDSLFELIERKSKKTFNFRQYIAKTEVQTGRGRIDILITNLQGNDAILIENKIHHGLNNDLLDYWQSVKTEESKKVGLLLTLHPHKIPEYVSGKFFNITHLEWLTLVKNNLNPDALTENYRVYITDFIATIEQLTTNYIMNESAKFYFQNAEKVLKATATIQDAYSFLNNQFQLIASSIGWQVSGNSPEWRNIIYGKNQLDTFLTIITKDLIKGQKVFTIILELNGKDALRMDEVKSILSDHPQTEGKNWGQSKGNYVHLLFKHYAISDEELETFANFVVQKIREDFADMTLKVIRHLYPHVTICEWEDNFLGKSSTTELI